MFMQKLRSRAWVILIVIVLLFGTNMSIAMPPYQFWRTYYTDATKTVECGYANHACNGTTYSGCRTEYYVDEIIARCGGNDDCVIPDNTNCRDGIDNDHDGKTDWSDPGCDCETGGYEWSV